MTLSFSSASRPTELARRAVGGVLAGPAFAARREALFAAASAAALSALVVAMLPQGGDAPAHLYRTFLLRHGVVLWDNLWYAGQYPLATYSLLYYLPAAAFGNVPLAFASVVFAAALFAALVVDEWGPIARWPARAFGVVAAAPLYTGSYSYAAGFAALLATLRSLQKRHTLLGILCATLTLGFSPLAFVFLCLALASAFLTHRKLTMPALAIAATLCLLVSIEFGLLVLFPSPGRYPFGIWRLLAGLAIATAGAALTFRSRRGAILTGLFVAWALANILAYVVPSPIGHNLLRADAFIFPVMLLAALLAGFRPRWLVVPALVAALAANVAPYLAMIPSRAADQAAAATFWKPLLSFLRRHSPPGYRVEVVPTANHWEAYFLPRAGFALLRGWYRQLDMADNPALYRKRLSGPSYRAWLRSRSVRYVVLPRTRLGPLGASREAQILRSGSAGLPEVYAGPTAVIYRVPGTPPLLSGPGAPVIAALQSDRISGRTTVPGTYRLRVNFTPYWRVKSGAVCVGREADGTTRLTVLHQGRFVLAIADGPAELVQSLLNGNKARCPSGSH